MNVLLHLLVSTLCVGLAALLALGLQHGPAWIRHRIWLCASATFLLPVSQLVVVGASLGAWTPAGVQPTVALAARWLDQSLIRWELDSAAAWPTSVVLPDTLQAAVLPMLLVWLSGAGVLTVWRCREWRDLSRMIQTAAPLTHGREASAMARVQKASPWERPVLLLLCDCSCEPAVVGVFRPRLLWPLRLSERLTDAELDAILAHEVCHVRRKDNLGALMHVVVEILFWFHPVIWWIGARLALERERACDEEVLQMGTDTQRYAEAILKVCGFSLRAPAAFAAGVGGSDLSGRIERILRRRSIQPLTLRTRLLLAGAVLLVAGTPLSVGVLNGHRIHSPSPAPSGSRAGAAGQDERILHRPGEGVTWPRLVHEAKPSYTQEAMQARIQGIVRLEVVVLEDGLVEEVTVVQSLDPLYGLDDEAVKAMKEWRFEPAMKDGQAVAVVVPVEMSFSLR